MKLSYFITVIIICLATSFIMMFLEFDYSYMLKNNYEKKWSKNQIEQIIKEYNEKNR